MTTATITGRCVGCQHWRSLTEEWDQPEIVADGRRVFTDDGDTVAADGAWGVCGAVAFLGPRDGSDRFYVNDASGYAASLKTRSDFGCTEWKAPETNEESHQ